MLGTLSGKPNLSHIWLLGKKTHEKRFGKKITSNDVRNLMKKCFNDFLHTKAVPKRKYFFGGEIQQNRRNREEIIDFY